MPVYNCEAYIEYSITSILEQLFQNWELIAVDDGSTDDSPAILDKFATQDPRIIVLHQANGGVAAARKAGLEKAIGKYITHVDADDWVEPGYLKEMYDMIESRKCDMVWCDAFVNEEKIWKHSCPEDAEVMIHTILRQEVWGTLWNRLWRREICTKEEFLIGCKMWEDMLFVVKCLLHTHSIAYLSRPLYHYRQRETSLVHTQNSYQVSEEYQKVIAELQRAFEEQGRLEDYREDLISLKLFAIRDYVDDIRFRNYDKFLNTYPEAIQSIWKYPNYPARLKVTSWLLQHNLRGLIPLVFKFDGLLRKLGLSKQI